ncbi:unnamed protein product [Cladocopium goreaui]|uniref:Type II methyltransferase M.NgoBI (M.NgoBI) (Cytosine-specific methyltransferase NgoBI) (M.NgoI) (Modification methylase NgoBI) n=1 Tax=Cladocopium goreaui TaxID=2562237 RepID=A0A9P1BX51_9DINO|nr:unnamed protein product [Cladocopium goreaui]
MPNWESSNQMDLWITPWEAMEEKQTSAESKNEPAADSGNADSDAHEIGEDKAAFGIESFETVMATYAELQASEDKQDKEDLQRLERHMTQARSLVKTYVVLEPETKSDEDLLESLKQSVAGSASGDAEKKTHTLVWYDQADAGEAQVQPHLRVPGLRNRGGHLQRFVRLVRQRKDPNQDLDPRDIYALCDCGKDGNKGRLIGVFCLAPEPDAAGKLQKPAPCKKQVRTWTATMSESSITERLAKVRGFSSINQIQRIHLITRNGLQLNEHQRLHSNGTNRGNFLGPFTASSWQQDSDAWLMRMKDKLVLLGKHGARIAVGGKEDDDDNIDASEGDDDEMEESGAKGGKPRDKNDMEPFLYHSPPSALCEELIQAVDPVAVVALAGDGRMAELCLERRIPFFGLAFTAEHCQALTARLEGHLGQQQQPAGRGDTASAQEEDLSQEKNKIDLSAVNGDEEGGEPAGSADGQIDGNNGQDGQVEKKPRKPKAKAKPETTAGDMLAELQKLAASAVECYPCQPYSVLGTGDGLESEDGKVLLYVLQRIRLTRPRTFLLENVENFQKFKKAYELVRDVLKALKDIGGKPYYKLQARVLNSKDHGVAQSRGRLYIVGVHDPVRDFRWPEPQAPVSLESALDPQDGSGPVWPHSKTEIRNLITCYKKLQDKRQPMRCDGIADIGMSSNWCQSSTPFSIGYAPCLTKSRCESNGYWSFSRQRKLHLSEYFRLQGIYPGRLQRPGDVTEAKMRAMVGNSFTVPVIAKIMDRLFYSAGLTSQPIAFDASTGDDGVWL